MDAGHPLAHGADRRRLALHHRGRRGPYPALPRRSASRSCASTPRSTRKTRSSDGASCGARAFNHGLDHVQTEWFSYLADDDEYDPCHHEALLVRADAADVVCGNWAYVTNGVRVPCSAVECPPSTMAVMQGAYIMRTSLEHRALETLTAPRGWDACWWRRLLERGAEIRWEVTPTVVAYYHPDVNGFGYSR